MKPRPTGLGSPISKPICRGLACPEEVWVGSSVSQALWPFRASVAGNLGVVSALSESYLQFARRVR
jgi:hypothetical protein